MNAWGKRPRSLSSTWRVSESYGINGARHRADVEEDDDNGSECEYQTCSSPGWSTEEHALDNHSPDVHSHARKRRHVDHEIGGHMSHMSLNDYHQPLSEPIRDEDMSHGNTYEISPNRIYVHTLDDDSSDEEGSPSNENTWEVHPGVVQQLGARMTVPRWIGLADESRPSESTSQSLVLWRPPVWTPPQVDANQEPMDMGM